MMRKIKTYILILISLLFWSCYAGKQQNNIIGLYFKNKNLHYLNQEIEKTAKEISFKENFKIFACSPSSRLRSDVAFFVKKGASVVIAEEEDIDRLEKLYRMLKRRDIKLALISSNITNEQYYDFFIGTDFSDLGRRLGDLFCQFTRKKRNSFLFFLCKIPSERQQQLVHSISLYLKEKNNIAVFTNYYDNPEKLDKNRLSFWVSHLSNDLRGIIVDEDPQAVLLGRELRKMRKDIEIKVASFGATREGISSLLKTEIAVSGDINRIALFTNSLLSLIDILKNNKENSANKTIYYDKGVCYTQINIMELLAETKKYSIQDIMTFGRKRN
ncbi:MAG: sugar ABC transporter substrate-binding protein [Spirochaetes bacterium]|nr:sugar ABC transporter substrate-binding protein [Spirochaetota bacterium]